LPFFNTNIDLIWEPAVLLVSEFVVPLLQLLQQQSELSVVEPEQLFG
jgi:hypothetical protein